MKALDDRYGRMFHFGRATAGYTTLYVEGEGYFWAHTSADHKYVGLTGGPFATRDEASADEITPRGKRKRSKQRPELFAL